MFKVLYALQPSLHYLMKAQVHTWTHKSFTLDVRKSYLKSWSQQTLKRLNVHLKTRGRPSTKPCLFVGNHISYLDIVLLLNKVPASFLAKKEIGKWPVIGNAARFLNTVFVDRQSKDSRKQSAERVMHKLVQEKGQVVIFPSGTTSIDESVSWRLGAFRIAKESRVPIQPFRIVYKPVESVAFLGEDLFLPHMHRLTKQPRIEAYLEFGKPSFVNNVERDMNAVKGWVNSGKSPRRLS